MKKLLALLLAAWLLLPACRAEDMVIMDWHTPTPAPTAAPTPAPTPDPTPASYANFRTVETNGMIYGLGRGFHPKSEVDVTVLDAAAGIEDVRFSWTDQAEAASWRDGWDQNLNQDTDAGKTVYLLLSGDAYAEAYGTDAGDSALWLFLPDQPELAGEQWVAFRVGGERVTVRFRLTYLGDYQQDLGWSLEDLGFTVS